MVGGGPSSGGVGRFLADPVDFSRISSSVQRLPGPGAMDGNADSTPVCARNSPARGGMTPWCDWMTVRSATQRATGSKSTASAGATWRGKGPDLTLVAPT
jgi:hypothetical protein